MTTQTAIAAISLASLPSLNSDFFGGTFAGVTTKPNGEHVAVILLPNKAQEVNWKKAMEWAKELDAELPSRPVAALLYANVKAKLDARWYWTCEEHVDDASYAWGCNFYYGGQLYYHKSYAGCAVAVRLIPLTA